MNTTIHNLIVAAPLATAALTLVPAAAMASEPGPVIAVPHHVDPQPDLDKVADPKPKPTHPDGPGNITNPKPCPTHGVDCTPNDDGDDDGRSQDSVDDAVGTVELPTRVDAGMAAEEPAPGELDLAWLFAGGLAVTASGVAFAVRKRTGSAM
jgi:hypothetical protein